jgi:hypothetical protein
METKTMSFSSFPGHKKAGPQISSAALHRKPNTGTRKARSRLLLERLEDRTVPSLFTVLNTNDSGAGSLRQAILDANAYPGADTIQFNIPGGGVQTIAPLNSLPALTDPVTIDGYTQPGASPNTLASSDNAVLQIVLDGSNAGSSGIGLQLTAGNNTVRGLVLGNWATLAIWITSSNNQIAGNFVGTDVTGTVSRPNGTVHISGFPGNTAILIGWASNPDSNIVGGTGPGDRNLISGNYGLGLNLYGATNTLVEGNFVGTDATGTLALGNQTDGIDVLGLVTGTVIGGTTASARNIISASGNRQLPESEFPGVGVRAECAGVTISGNYIGTDVTGMRSLGNAVDGVFAYTYLVGPSPEVTVGGTQPGAGNLISGNGQSGVDVGKSGVVIQGNLIGTDVTGTYTIPNGQYGVYIRTAGNGQPDLVGGSVPGARNLISGNRSQAIAVESSGNLIQGNYIGTDITGSVALDRAGIYLFPQARNTYIGTDGDGVSDASEGNLIYGFITIDGSNNVVAGNIIGADRTGTQPLANPNDVGGTLGISIRFGASDNRIGSNFDGVSDNLEANQIAFNFYGGIDVDGGTATGNRIWGNSIFANGPSDDRSWYDRSRFGNGITLSEGGNNSQPAPTITSLSVTSSALAIGGTFAGPANATVTLEFFSSAQPDSTGFGEGQTLLTHTTATTDGAGHGTFSITVPLPAAGQDWISATATDPSGNTSQFSAVRTLLTNTTVVNTQDSGPGSLRNAILVADDSFAPQATITFNIPTTDPGYVNGTFVIQPVSPLPALTTPVVIDGYTQPGSSPNTHARSDPDPGDNAKRLITLDGATAPFHRIIDGLNLAAGHSTVRGLNIHDFFIPIHLTMLGNDTIEGNSVDHIQVDAANNTIGGTTPAARNLIGNIVIYSGNNNVVQGNFIGLDATGNVALSGEGGSQGVEIDSNGNIIGGPYGAGNVIAGFGLCVAINTNSNVVQGNFIGTNATGTAVPLGTNFQNAYMVCHSGSSEATIALLAEQSPAPEI